MRREDSVLFLHYSSEFQAAMYRHSISVSRRHLWRSATSGEFTKIILNKFTYGLFSDNGGSNGEITVVTSQSTLSFHLCSK